LIRYGVELTVGDLTDAASLETLFDGVDAAFAMTTPIPGGTEQETSVAEPAVETPPSPAPSEPKAGYVDQQFTTDPASAGAPPPPSQAEQDAQRGAGNWALIHEQATRCRRLGVPVTITAVMMKANYSRLAEVAQVAKKFEAPLRVNVYQSVRTDAFALTYQEYWEGFRRLFAETDVIIIGEPLVRAFAGLPPLPGGCGVGTVRVTPRATTQACVYWSSDGEPLSRLFEAGEEIVNTPAFVAARILPPACEPCEFRETCHGGCAGRRQLQGTLDEPDSYCPIIRGEHLQLEIKMAAARDLPKIGSACTTVVIARD